LAGHVADWREQMGELLETERNYIRVELIDDPADIARCWLKSHRPGDRMICRRCGNADFSISAILVVPAGGESRWALCSRCVLELP
jgi:hypothetical protein